MAKVLAVLRHFPNFLTLMFMGFRKYRVMSIDVTYRCNLNCKTCYFKRAQQNLELSDDEWLSLIREFKVSNPNCFGGWIGGEPLLRKSLVEKGMALFEQNLLVTNGTISWKGLPKNCSILVSLDGIGQGNDLIRGVGSYERTMRNIQNSDRPIATTTTVNRLNFRNLEEIVQGFRGVKTVHCSYFTFYTPSEEEDFELCLTEDEREWAIDLILKLKERHGPFIANSRLALELMRANHREEVISDCAARRACCCMSAQGEKKFCVLGSTADCSRCGDYEVHHLLAIERRDLESIRMGFRLFGVNTFAPSRLS